MQIRRWNKWLLFFAAWTLVGLIYIGLDYFTFFGVTQLASRVSEEAGAASARPSVWEVLFWNLASFYEWALLSPLILWLARRWPLERRAVPRLLLVHAPASVVLGAVHLSLYVFVYVAGRGPRVDIFPSPADLYGYYFYRFLPVNILIYWIILVIIYALDYYRKYQEGELKASELRAQLAQAQLQALKMQLHPHFLFNTLNAVSELVYKDPDAAEQMIAQLSDMLRLSLDKVGVQEVALKEELDFLSKYLEIEQTRFRDRLSVELHIDPRALDACVPNMILQPLVENAVRHGIAPRAAGGRIEIRARRAGRMLHVSVRDDGRGLPAEPEQLATKGGVGLSNTRARLERLYGAAHRFELDSRPGQGLTVRLAIPFHENADAEERSEPHQSPDSGRRAVGARAHQALPQG